MRLPGFLHSSYPRPIVAGSELGSGTTKMKTWTLTGRCPRCGWIAGPIFPHPHLRSLFPDPGHYSDAQCFYNKPFLLLLKLTQKSTQSTTM